MKQAEELKKETQAAEKKAKDAAEAHAKAEKELQEAEKKTKEQETLMKEAMQTLQKEVPSELSEADQKKKEKQRPKVDKVIAKCEVKKAAAADKFKIGQYGDAVKDYAGAVQVLDSAVEDFPLFKQELMQVEATIFNNIAACHKKELNSKLEIEYTTKVIDRQEYITDSSVLLKAYLRRGLAYEQLEKFAQGKEDMLSVKEIQSDNKHASQCLNRCQKAIKDIYGDKVPEVKKNKPFKANSTPEAKKESPPAKKESDINFHPIKTEESTAVDENLSVEEISELFIKIKEEGNAEFKDKSYLMAASKFTEGISVFKKNEETVKSNQELKTKAIQLFTNRSLAMHNMGNTADAFSDADYVLEKLDSKNAKALFRRAQGYKTKGKTALAIKDLEQLSKIEPKNAACKKDLIELKVQLKDEPEETTESKNKPKIEEV